ncbi:MAG: superoxide dismutase [Bacteroidales bacterium]|nr:superoxide dismutase [Bacteroidales bacterium]
MKIFAIDKLLQGASLEKIQPFLKDEARHAWKLHKEGYLRELNFRTDRPGVIVVMEVDSIEQAREIMSELPLVREKLIDFEYIPVGAFLPFEDLFEKY